MRLVPIVLILALVGAVGATAQTRDGEQIYTQVCARCHDSNLPQILTAAPIQEYAADRIYEAMTFGFMVREAAGLSKDEKRAVAEYVSGSPVGSLRPPLDQIPQSAYCSAGDRASDDALSGPTWNGWSPDLSNTRFQPTAAAGMTATQVPDLALKWAFGFPGVSAASLQATIAGGQALVGTSVGLVYALDAQTGCINWIHEADVGVRSTISVGSDADGRATAYFGDLAASVYAVDFATGARRWKVKVEDHPDARITGAPALHDGRLYVPVASFEELTAAVATYQCCTFRGSIVALDASTGTELWKTFAITEAPQRTRHGAAGRGDGDTRGHLLGQPRRPHPRLCDRDRRGRLGRRHGRRVRHGERRAGTGRRAEWPGRNRRRWDALRQLRLQHARVHAGERAAGLLGRRSLTCFP